MHLLIVRFLRIPEAVQRHNHYVEHTNENARRDLHSDPPVALNASDHPVMGLKRHGLAVAHARIDLTSPTGLAFRHHRLGLHTPWFLYGDCLPVTCSSSMSCRWGHVATLNQCPVSVRRNVVFPVRYSISCTISAFIFLPLFDPLWDESRQCSPAHPFNQTTEENFVYPYDRQNVMQCISYGDWCYITYSSGSCPERLLVEPVELHKDPDGKFHNLHARRANESKTDASRK